MIFNLIFLSILTIFAVIEYKIIFFQSETLSGVDYVIVLGSKVNGEEPEKILKSRLDKTLEYIDLEDKAKIIVSGGKASNENMSEAEVMEKYLIENGINSNRILKEDKSANTFQNLNNTKDIIESKSESISNIKVAVVTSDFHAHRAKYYAKKIGYDNIFIVKSNSEYILKPVMYAREFFAVIKSYLIV